MGRNPAAAILATAYYLPEQIVSNEALAAEFPEWNVHKISDKTGFVSRRLAGEDEFATDLAYKACQKLFEEVTVSPSEVDFLILVTQSPDYALPTSACIMQNRLGLPTTIGALDVNLGCSGFIYGLSLAKGLVETGQATCVLLVTAETYSKHMNPCDKSVRTIFGDGAAATLVGATDPDTPPHLGPFAFGTDGSGAMNLVVPGSGVRPAFVTPAGNNKYLYMNGPEIFAFTLQRVPEIVSQILAKAELSLDAVDAFVFHQANKYILQHLQQKLDIDDERFIMASAEAGNTVSSSIPIALANAKQSGSLRAGQRIMLVGFGVGYSYAACLARLL
ncbi:beta-ketoacyl-ACP synthase 3 [Desulfovibrio aerotolerans]|uniref:Beta-ketoacyl-ACP synthase 3 n=1 Tax=Solidesulfovibrio aerotolerans TaxID=295255 RepID=A0A7C9N2B0_9BACT|nr:ketoacyl-ACP synthase III [Solidesulfovibrio aerotolerans]MYL84637.1 beta-ketoacyl-ACP synthase 3 [Solidesulfovibrio aerotolerans]